MFERVAGESVYGCSCVRKICFGGLALRVFPSDGKSLWYGCLSLFFDKLLRPKKLSIVCVVTPLNEIIVDQSSLNLQENVLLILYMCF